MTATETATEVRELTYLGAFNEGLRQMMAADPDVFIAGEDVGLQGGVFGAFTGIQEQFGEERAIDTPISRRCCCARRWIRMNAATTAPANNRKADALNICWSLSTSLVSEL